MKMVLQFILRMNNCLMDRIQIERKYNYLWRNSQCNWKYVTDGGRIQLFLLYFQRFKATVCFQQHLLGFRQLQICFHLLLQAAALWK